MPSRSSSSSGRSSSSSRSSYSSSRSSYSRPSYTPRSTPVAPAPATVPTATSVPIQHIIQVQQPGFFSSIIQGFGLGAGQSIAHNIFRSNPTVTHIHETASSASTASSALTNSSKTESLSKEYIQCMKDNNDDKDFCKMFLDSSKYLST